MQMVFSNLITNNYYVMCMTAGSKGFVFKRIKSSCYEVDISDKDKCVATVKRVADANDGNVHLLINCAAYFGSKGNTAEKADWDKTFSVNVVGYSNMVQACCRYMKEMKAVDKSIVNIASISGHRVQPSRWTYSASKGAILSVWL